MRVHDARSFTRNIIRLSTMAGTLLLGGLFAGLVAPQPAAAETLYPWCLQSTRGDRNCGFVSQQQCFAARTANADMCQINTLVYWPGVNPAPWPPLANAYGSNAYGSYAAQPRHTQRRAKQPRRYER